MLEGTWNVCAVVRVQGFKIDRIVETYLPTAGFASFATITGSSKPEIDAQGSRALWITRYAFHATRIHLPGIAGGFRGDHAAQRAGETIAEGPWLSRPREYVRQLTDPTPATHSICGRCLYPSSPMASSGSANSPDRTGRGTRDLICSLRLRRILKS